MHGEDDGRGANGAAVLDAALSQEPLRVVSNAGAFVTVLGYFFFGLGSLGVNSVSVASPRGPGLSECGLHGNALRMSLRSVTLRAQSLRLQSMSMVNTNR